MAGLRLIHIGEGSFRSSEATKIDEVLRRYHVVVNTNEAAAFISIRGDQIVLVRTDKMKWHNGHMRKVYVSQRFRVDGDYWTLEDIFRACQKFGVDLGWIRDRLEMYFNRVEEGKKEPLHFRRHLRAA